MSGNHASSNPFRRKPPVAELPSVTKHGGSDNDRPFLLQKGSPKQATRKQVRIKTPPSRYDEWSQSTPTSAAFGQSSPDGHSLSTASDSSTSPDGSPDELPIDSTHHLLDEEEEGPEDEELLRNTRRNSFTSTPASQSTQQRPPLNPFSTTSATLEESPTDASDCSEVASPMRPRLSGKQESSSARPSLDVDSFKRLLLTGNASQSTSAQIPASAPPSAQLHMQPGIPGDSGSSTDASSISRQSIFEQTLDISHDTPSSSHDISPSENERRRSWTETPPSAERKKPPPPKSRHGKRPETPAPQNVPFKESPALSASVAALSSPQPHPLPYEPVSSVNKVLPAPPIAQFPMNEPPAQEFTGDVASQTLPQEPPYPLPTPQKRVPPPPPLARRYSQLRSSNATSNPGQPIRSKSDEQPATTAPSVSSEAQVSTPHKNPPPPPPPPRHRGFNFSEAPPFNPSEASTAPTNPDPPEPTTTTLKHTPSAPPPPPSRTPSISSLKRPLRASPNSTAQGGMPPPPPPPPPRNRGSSQSSLDYRPLFPSTGSNRASGEFRRPSNESQRRASGTSSLGRAPEVLEQSTEIEEGSKGIVANDILGDLETLQREVDELRGRYATGKDG